MKQHGQAAEEKRIWKNSTRGIAVDVLYGLTGQGSPVKLPGGVMHRTSGNKDSDAGPFYAPVCPVHYGRFGEGKPPPPCSCCLGMK